jgi:hypothetical protein
MAGPCSIKQSADPALGPRQNPDISYDFFRPLSLSQSRQMVQPSMTSESLASELVRVRCYGVGGPLGRLTEEDLPGIAAIGRKLALAPLLPLSQLVEYAVRQAIEHLHPLSDRQAAAAMFGLDLTNTGKIGERYVRKLVSIRYEEAAALLDLEPSYLERYRQHDLLRDIAEQLVAISKRTPNVDVAPDGDVIPSVPLMDALVQDAISLTFGALTMGFVLVSHDTIHQGLEPSLSQYRLDDKTMWQNLRRELERPYSCLSQRFRAIKKHADELDRLTVEDISGAIAKIHTQLAGVALGSPFQVTDAYQERQTLKERLDIILERGMEIEQLVAYRAKCHDNLVKLGQHLALRSMLSYYWVEEWRPIFGGSSLEDLATDYFNRERATAWQKAEAMA